MRFDLIHHNSFASQGFSHTFKNCHQKQKILKSIIIQSSEQNIMYMLELEAVESRLGLQPFPQSGHNSIVTPLLIQAWKLYHTTYSIIWPTPIQIKISVDGDQNQKVSFQLDSVLQPKYIPFLISELGFTLLIAIGTCITLPLLQLFSSQYKFGALPVLVCVFCLGATVFEFGLYYISAKQPEGYDAYNQLFKLEQRIQNQPREWKAGREKRNLDPFGMLLMSLNLINLNMLPLFAPTAIFSNLDPFYFLFEIVLPSPYYRSIGFIVGVPFIRLLITYVCIFEYARFYWLVTFIVLSLQNTAQNCLNIINSSGIAQITNRSSRMSETKIMSIYTQLRIIFAILDNFTCSLVGLVLVCMQVLLTSILWLCIKCRRFVPLYIWGLFIGLALIGLSCTVIFFPKYAQFCELSETFVRKKQAQYFTFGRGRAKYRVRAFWVAQRRLPIRVGMQFLLKKDLPINYLAVLMTNVTNATLLIQP